MPNTSPMKRMMAMMISNTLILKKWFVLLFSSFCPRLMMPISVIDWFSCIFSSCRSSMLLEEDPQQPILVGLTGSLVGSGLGS